MKSRRWSFFAAVTAMSVLMTSLMTLDSVDAHAATHYSQSNSAVPVSRNNFGINTAVWDYAMTANSTVAAIRELGTGYQRFPNDSTWNWHTNLSRNKNDNYTSWNSFHGSMSLLQWGQELEQTNNSGVFNINYGINPTWTGGESVDDVKQLTQYIVGHHLPVRAMVIGSEDYMGTPVNLRKDKSAQRYADVVKQMALAIHHIDPGMLVGVNLSPGTDGLLGMHDLAWNQTVLREDAPYIQFVTYHVYPVNKVTTDAGVLQQIAQDIPQTYSQIRTILRADAGIYANRIQVWVTEFNMYNLAPPTQTTQSVAGAAVVEGLLQWRQLGVNQVDWWSLHCGTTQHGSSFGTWGLLANGSTSQGPVNQPFPSATAMSDLMKAIGNGGSLSSVQEGPLYIARISEANHATFAIVNQSNKDQVFSMSGKTYKVHGASYLLVEGASSTWPTSAYVTRSWPSMTGVSPTMPSLEVATPRGVASASQTQIAPVPHISSVVTTIQNGQKIIQISGKDFGTNQGVGYVTLKNGDTSWGSPLNWYKTDIISWTSTQIDIVQPSSMGRDATTDLQPGTAVTVNVVSGSDVLSAPCQFIYHNR